MRTARAIAFAIAALHAGLAIAQSTGETRRTDELMHKSGLWNQVGQIESQVKAGAAEARAEAKARNSPAPLTDTDAARLDAAIAFAFAPARLRGAVASQLGKELSSADESEVLVWLDSDLGRKITALEEASSEEPAGNAQREAESYIDAMPASRLEKLQRFVRMVRAGESSAAALISITTAIVYGVALATPPSDTSAAEALGERLRSQRPRMEAVFTQQAVGQFAYIYRALSDDELDRYIAFADTPSGRNYHDATVKVMEDVLTHASLDMGREIGRTRPRQPPVLHS